jgi:hypothetical protein
MKTIHKLGTAALTNLVIVGSAFAANTATAPMIDNPVGGGANFGNVLAKIIDFLLVFAGAVAVLFLIIGGFRYVVSAGNAEQVEAAKKTVLYAILGLIIIFVAFAIVQLVLVNGLGVDNSFLRSK